MNQETQPSEQALEGTDRQALRLVYDQLCAAWPAEAVDIRPGQITEEGDKVMALAIPFVHPRFYAERLDRVVGAENWQDQFASWTTRVIIYRLSIFLHTKQSTGREGGSPTHKYSTRDNALTAEERAFESANSKFGLGRYLALLPPVWGEFNRATGSFESPRELVEQMYHEAGIPVEGGVLPPSFTDQPVSSVDIFHTTQEPTSADNDTAQVVPEEATFNGGNTAGLAQEGTAAESCTSVGIEATQADGRPIDGDTLKELQRLETAVANTGVARSQIEARRREIISSSAVTDFTMQQGRRWVEYLNDRLSTIARQKNEPTQAQSQASHAV